MRFDDYVAVGQNDRIVSRGRETRMVLYILRGFRNQLSRNYKDSSVAKNFGRLCNNTVSIIDGEDKPLTYLTYWQKMFHYLAVQVAGCLNHMENFRVDDFVGKTLHADFSGVLARHYSNFFPSHSLSVANLTRYIHLYVRFHSDGAVEIYFECKPEVTTRAKAMAVMEVRRQQDGKRVLDCAEVEREIEQGTVLEEFSVYDGKMLLNVKPCYIYYPKNKVYVGKSDKQSDYRIYRDIVTGVQESTFCQRLTAVSVFLNCLLACVLQSNGICNISFEEVKGEQ